MNENSSIQNLVDRLKADYPEFIFKVGKKFAFRPPRMIVIGAPEPFDELLLLHEVAHALLEHRNYNEDLERLKMENEAWEKAKELASQYQVEANEDLIQDELDTYRNWLHKKSCCPNCGLTRFQTPDCSYHCPRCENLT